MNMLNTQPAVMLIVYAILICFLLLIVLDAAKRYPEGSFKPVIWALFVLLTGFTGLIFYILLRAEMKKASGG